MRSKSSALSESSSTRIGKRPCSSGIRSDGLARVESAGRDEQNVIGADHAVFGHDRGAFDNRQDIALNAFAADIRAGARVVADDLVDFVDKD